MAGAAAYLRNLTSANGKIGVIGYCSGGRQSVLAAATVPLDAAVDCYGGLVTGTPPQGSLMSMFSPIKHLIKEEERARSLEIGKKILERELRKASLSPNESLKSGQILAPFKEQGIRTLDELFVAVGYGKISNKISPALKAAVLANLLRIVSRTARRMTDEIAQLAG